MLDVAFVELVLFVNVPHDRTLVDGTHLAGESLHDTAVRIDKIISTPPAPVVRAQVVPLEDRDPDAPPGWYDEPDMTSLWAVPAAEVGAAVLG